ncbi:MAG TPA: phosphatidylglycerol lysyltransferase domain-containing protein [Bacteroidales bacterium]|nr:phosphatidylglycerol lysyltransferase domain-containing protein [Bacteroidales bacterium]HPS74724.1 phosphatidylglycerol lysyltransferase domain-containing protein [Bacteroidales bacterium]
MKGAIVRPGVIADLVKRKLSLLGGNRKIISRFLLAVLFIAVGAWFVKHEQTEVGQVRNVLFSSRWQFVLLGVVVTGVYIVLQGFMYKLAFASSRNEVTLRAAILLFLKRNFISIFMPAGGVTSLAFFTGEVEKEGVPKTRIHIASSIYAFVGILSVVLVAVPVFTYTLFNGIAGTGEMIALSTVILLIAIIFIAYRSIVRKKALYRLIIRISPATEVFLEDLISHSIRIRYLILTILVSIAIDLTGMLDVYIAMVALGFQASVFYAVLGYLAAVLSLMVSPFMRGLGTVEVSLSFFLTRFGYSAVEAIAITFLYRFFEFWLPLAAGALSFFAKINKLLMRIIPALLIFVLGIINIISAITPAIHERMLRLEEFIPIDLISASNYFVLISGIVLLLTAVFMFKGLRNAWGIAFILGIVSMVGHLTKAIDYEEAGVALLVIVMLVFSRKEYYVRGNPRMHIIGIRTALSAAGIVLLYGIIGFYYLDKKHFGIDFNIWQSIRYSIQHFLLVGSPDLVPHSRFAKDFLLTINLSGFLSLSFLFYTIIRPYIFKASAAPEDLIRARDLVEKYGESGLDYFKTYKDKQFFLPEGLNAFIAYRVAGNFAVVLENPVAENPEIMKKCIVLFDKYCYENGVKSLFYRVPEKSLPVYHDLKKKSLFIGQEGMVDLATFTLEGGRNKALRNAINKVIDRGYTCLVHTPPIRDGLLQKLRVVSDEWLSSTQRSEITFSQGMFDWEELKQQTIITVENPEEKVIAFVNIIPDHSPAEGTYDLIRKTQDAPNGVLDFLLVELLKYFKSNNYTTVNLGFAPLSGLEVPVSLKERSMKFAYNKIKSFSHYKGLRLFKEKFFPQWYNRYLVYSNDYDLFQVPSALTRVIKPPV